MNSLIFLRCLYNYFGHLGFMSLLFLLIPFSPNWFTCEVSIVLFILTYPIMNFSLGVFAPLSDRFGLIHQARISASVNAMRVLNTGTEVEAAVADALVRDLFFCFILVCVYIYLFQNWNCLSWHTRWKQILYRNTLQVA